MRFTTEQKVRIVQLCAQRMGPTEVIERLRREFPGLRDMPIALTSIKRYNPATRAGRTLSRHLRTVYSAARERRDDSMADTLPATQGWRISKLMHLVYQSESDPKLCAKLLEQIAKEMGGAYERKAKHNSSVDDGELLDIVPLTPAEKVERLRRLMQVDDQLRENIEKLLRNER
jgi:hypothetical protein